MALFARWKPNTRTRGVSAAAAQDVVAKLEAKHEFVKAEHVVAAAKSRRSPIHPFFEWDDKVAAHEHRLAEGRYLLRSLVFVEEQDTKEKVIGHAYIHVESVNAYVGAQRLSTDEELRAEAIAKATKELKAWRRRHQQLVELRPIFEAIDTLE